MSITLDDDSTEMVTGGANGFVKVSLSNSASSSSLALGWFLEEIHVTWAQLEKKWTKPRPYTNYLKENHTVRGDDVANYKRQRHNYSRDGTQKPRKAKRTTEISQSSGPIHLVADETVYKEWEDRMERAATTASSLEAEQDSGNINRTQSMATLNESFPQGNLIRIELILLVLAKSASASSIENRDMEITCYKYDGKIKVVSDRHFILRRHSRGLEDSDGISTLPTS
ncbi:hypothetical protein Tco_0309764 [Tanacetum coccineum]